MCLHLNESRYLPIGIFSATLSNRRFSPTVWNLQSWPGCHCCCWADGVGSTSTAGVVVVAVALLFDPRSPLLVDKTVVKLFKLRQLKRVLICYTNEHKKEKERDKRKEECRYLNDKKAVWITKRKNTQINGQVTGDTRSFHLTDG